MPPPRWRQEPTKTGKLPPPDKRAENKTTSVIRCVDRYYIERANHVYRTHFHKTSYTRFRSDKVKISALRTQLFIEEG